MSKVIEVSFSVLFPLSVKKKAQDRDMLFKRMRALLEKEEESLSVRKILYKKRYVFLEDEQFRGILYFGKPISFRISIMKDFQENKVRVNSFANKLMNYLNIVLGESAKKTRITTAYAIEDPSITNLVKKFVDETRVAKISETIKRTVTPIGILFEFESGKHKNTVMQVGNSPTTSILSVMSHCIHSESLKWDFIKDEYENLEQVIQATGRVFQEAL